MTEEENDLYSLEKLIKVLETIKENGSGHINYPKSIYCLALEIRTLKETLNGILYRISFKM